MSRIYQKAPQILNTLIGMQFNATRYNATGRPFGEYDNYSGEGVYVDVVSGGLLLSSKDTFQSGCGKPAFSRPADNDVCNLSDLSHGMVCTEARFRHGDSHLDHVFPDGPQDKGGPRYCINSAALCFIPKVSFATEGYGEFLFLFESGGKHEN